MASKGRPPTLPPGEAEARQAARKAAVLARCREKRKAEGLTTRGTPRKRAPNGTPEKPRKPRTEEQKARAKERRKAKGGTGLAPDAALIGEVIAAAVPQGAIAERKAMKRADYARFRERNLAAGLTTKGWPRLRHPDGKVPPPSERAAKRSSGQEEDERAAAKRAAARRASNAKYRAKKLAAGLTTEGKPWKRAAKAATAPPPEEVAPISKQIVDGS